MSKNIFFLAVFIMSSFGAIAQRAFLLGLQTDLGVPINSYTMNKEVLKSHVFSYNFQGGLSLQYKLWDRVSLELGASQSISKWRIKDKDFENRHPGFVVDLRNKIYYYSCFGNIQLLQRLSSRTFLYVQGGYSINMVGKKSLTQSRLFVLDNENVTATSEYQAQTASVNTEIGFQFVGRKSVFGLGIKMNLGKDNLLNGSYQVENGGTVIKEDNFFSNGSFIGLNAKYSFILSQRDKKVRAPRVKEPPKQEPVVKTPPPVDPKKSTQVAGRDLKVTHKVDVVGRKVTIKVWDHETVDGDRISLNLNGRWVLENHTLTKTQHVFVIELEPGKNVFVLHALNLGKYSPNTAALIIHDGKKENRIILESTLETSGTIEVNCVP